MSLPVRYGIVVLAFAARLTGTTQCVTAYPQLEDFEGVPAWTIAGASPDWAWGAPAHPLINSAGGGVNSWCVGGLSGSFYNLGEQSWIESGCYDMSTLDHPWVSFKIFWETERDYDGVNLQYSINGGATWANVGAYGDPVDCLNDNWYNNANVLNVPAFPKHGWSGRVGATAGSCIGGAGSGAWVEAKHCLPAACANQPDVRLRFLFGAGTTCNDYDGVAIDDVLVQDAEPSTAIISFTCTGTAVDFQTSTTSCPTSFTWDFGDPASGAANTSTLATPLHVFTASGTAYTVTLTVTGPCSDPYVTTIPVNIPDVTINVTDPLCSDSTGSLTAVVTGASGPVDYLWSPGGETTATINGLAPGAYSVVVSAPGVCEATASATIVAPPPVTVTAMNDTTVCADSDLILTAVGGGGTGAITFDWSPAGPLLSPASPGVYTVIATDANGCTSPPDDVTVGLQLAVVPQFATTDPEGCEPWCVTFTDQTPGSTSASWDFGDGATASNDPAPLHCYGDDGWYAVTLTVTDANGCTGALTLDSAVHVLPAPTAGFVPDPPVARITEPVIHFIDASSGADEWAWDFGVPASPSDTAASPSFTFPDVGCYTVTQIVTNVEGCSDTTAALVCIEDEFALYAPNAFTPDGDGINDAWLPITTVYFPLEFELLVFDRWGQEVFTTTDRYLAWDGRIDGSEAPIGVYAWTLRMRDAINERHQASGHVVVIR